MKKIGIFSLQGSVTEHLVSMKKAVESTGLNASVDAVASRKQLAESDALVFPGGESTTIGRLIRMYGLDGVIKNFVAENKPVMGTCAGMVLLASKVEDNRFILGCMDLEVERNAFGRQRESFEKDLSIKGFKGNYPAVFIRAPAIKSSWGRCEVLAKVDGLGVMAKQDNIIVLSFHPELVSDTRVQCFFLDLLD
ncbi:MAG: pyridoxal 5'-phosphate synthase glutaminase subunit PdxT [Candidatus Altiarchaeales archaeon ex4484_96]|nr:MAG: pyridoxal 5'-phosphate synthase glutaminase subunit PdxT [Candidatus Altiarchaeales archaeon ex4484_96]